MARATRTRLPRPFLVVPVLLMADTSGRNPPVLPATRWINENVPMAKWPLPATLSPSALLSVSADAAASGPPPAPPRTPATAPPPAYPAPCLRRPRDPNYPAAALRAASAPAASTSPWSFRFRSQTRAKFPRSAATRGCGQGDGQGPTPPGAGQVSRGGKPPTRRFRRKQADCQRRRMVRSSTWNSSAIRARVQPW
jgi:hypothetical protein